MRKLIVLIHVGHPNDIESARSLRRSFAHFGYSLEELSVSDPNAGAKLDALLRERSSDIFCFVSANFYALAIRSGEKLIHDATGIPLVIMMHDHPIYFLSQLTPALNGSIIFAPGDDACDFIHKYYPIKVQAVPNFGSLPDVEGSIPSWEQFQTRQNVIFAPMNLHIARTTLDSAWLAIRDLPPARKTRAMKLSERLLEEPAMPLHVAAEQVDPSWSSEEQRPTISDQLLVLNYVKLWRRITMVRALIDLPILVSSEYVPGDLEMRYPNKFTLLTTAETSDLYAQYRFTLNAHPLLMDLPHDRIIHALNSNSVCITDANRAILSDYHDEVDMIFFRYGSDSMFDKIARYIDEPEKAYALTVHASKSRSALQRHFIDCYQALLNAVNDRWTGDQVAPHL